MQVRHCVVGVRRHRRHICRPRASRVAAAVQQQTLVEVCLAAHQPFLPRL